jgi:hypothetical protein
LCWRKSELVASRTKTAARAKKIFFFARAAVFVFGNPLGSFVTYHPPKQFQAPKRFQVLK